MSDIEKMSEERIDYKKLNNGSYDVGVDEVKVASFFNIRPQLDSSRLDSSDMADSLNLVHYISLKEI